MSWLRWIPSAQQSWPVPRAPSVPRTAPKSISPCRTGQAPVWGWASVAPGLGERRDGAWGYPGLAGSVLSHSSPGLCCLWEATPTLPSIEVSELATVGGSDLILWWQRVGRSCGSALLPLSHTFLPGDKDTSLPAQVLPTFKWIPAPTLMGSGSCSCRVMCCQVSLQTLDQASWSPAPGQNSPC